MKLPSFVSRTFIPILCLVGLDASAGRLPNLVPCEAMLSEAARAADDQNASTALATLREQLEAKGPKTVGHRRNLEHIESLIAPHRDAQIFTLVFRGNQVREGVDRFYAARERLGNLYQSYRASRPSGRLWAERLVVAGLFAASIFQSVHGSSVLINEGWQGLATSGGGLNAVMTLPSMVIGVAMVWETIHKAIQFEFNPQDLKSQLIALVAGQTKEPFISFAAFDTTESVVSGLLRSNLSNEVRTEAYRRLTNSAVADFGDFLADLQSMDRIVGRTAAERKVRLGHVLFHDEERNEPVWVFVMRSERKRFGGMRPSKRKHAFVKPTPPMGWAGGM